MGSKKDLRGNNHEVLCRIESLPLLPLANVPRYCQIIEIKRVLSQCSVAIKCLHVDASIDSECSIIRLRSLIIDCEGQWGTGSRGDLRRGMIIQCYVLAKILRCLCQWMFHVIAISLEIKQVLSKCSVAIKCLHVDASIESECSISEL